jgi:hypothetical protein
MVQGLCVRATEVENENKRHSNISHQLLTINNPNLSFFHARIAGTDGQWCGHGVFASAVPAPAAKAGHSGWAAIEGLAATAARAKKSNTFRVGMV